MNAETRFQSFREFYPYYLSEHSDPTCRRLHYLGSLLVIAVVLFSLVTQAFIWLLLVPVIGYGFAWIGHFFFEHNRPATFKYPLYSLMGIRMIGIRRVLKPSDAYHAGINIYK